MSETRAALTQLKIMWRNLTQLQRGRVLCWLFGVGMMGAAIILTFGWPGALFCAGVIAYDMGITK